MPPIDAGVAARIVGQREVMISLAGLCLVLLTLLLGRVNSAVILLTSSNETWSFPDAEANFAPRIPAAGIMGVLHKANPQDACSPLVKDPDSQRSLLPPFVVVARGACNFDLKVRHAQEAGFGAVIVYNNVDDHELVTSMTPLTPVAKEAVFRICLCFSSFGFK
jgi:E3 ubiquitin-protein ligase RNF13